MEIRKCVQCGQEFIITDSEIVSYKRKKFSLPRRCKMCRKKNREEKEKYSKGSERRNRNKSKWVLATVWAVLAVVCLFLKTDSFSFLERNQNTGTLISTQQSVDSDGAEKSAGNEKVQYAFRNSEYLQEHYSKHGAEFSFDSAEAYEKGANEVIQNENALHKNEQEDGDDVYYLEESNEFVVLSTDGYIRTYFRPDDGIEYYERQ